MQYYLVRCCRISLKARRILLDRAQALAVRPVGERPVVGAVEEEAVAGKLPSFLFRFEN